MEIYDLARSLVTNFLLVTLLFTLARPRARRTIINTVLVGIVLLNFGLNAFFYLKQDYSSLAVGDIVFFVAVGVLTKPLFKERLMQWLFNCFTVINIYAIVVVVSYYLAELLPYPHYAHTVIRAILFVGFIFLFRNFLRPIYRQTAEQWSIYLFVSIVLSLSIEWYFVSSDDVRQSLDQNIVPIILQVVIVVLTYIAMFYSLYKTLGEAALREDNLKVQTERDLIRHRLSLMDETVRQMSIAQHDRRHFNNTLLCLLDAGEITEATALLRKQSKSMPAKSRRFCKNISVNAAVSYFVEVAISRGIKFDIRLDIPENLAIDELLLVMAVSNLMENAITAVSNLPNERRYFKFYVIYTGQLLIEISNPYDGDVYLSEDGIPVAETDGHGNGSCSIKEFVKRYDGELLYTTDDGIFKVQIML